MFLKLCGCDERPPTKRRGSSVHDHSKFLSATVAAAGSGQGPNRGAADPTDGERTRANRAAQIDDELFQPLPAPHSRRFERLMHFCESNEGEVLASLPHIAAELADAVGFETLFVFLRAHNGNTVSLGSDPQVFARRYGLPVTARRFETLQQLCGGNANVDVPSGCGILNALRRVAVRQHLERTGDARETARRFGVTRRYLRKLQGP